MDLRKGKSKTVTFSEEDAVVQAVVNMPPIEKDPMKLLAKTLEHCSDWLVEPRPRQVELVVRKPDELLILRTYRAEKAARIASVAAEVYKAQIKNLSKHIKK